MHYYMVLALHQHLPYDVLYHILQVFEYYKHTELTEIYTLLVKYSNDSESHELWNDGEIFEENGIISIFERLPFWFDVHYFPHNCSNILTYNYHAYTIMSLQNAILIRSKMVDYISLL
jgi:hypothetical protein